MAPESFTDRGWTHPPLARKAHYFEDGRSLCRKWDVIGRFRTTDPGLWNQCKTCANELAKAKGGER